MKRIATAALAALAVATGAQTAGAADDDKSLIPESWVAGKFSANVAATSEYFFRGISQTDDTPAIQGGFDWNLESIAGSPVGVYAGFWASNVDFNVGNHLEMDFYTGLAISIAPIDTIWKVGGIYYYYPGTPKDAAGNSTHQDYAELATSLYHDFGLAGLTFMFNYSPDFFASTGNAYYVAAKVDIPIWKFTLSPIAGRQWIKENAQFGAPDYWHYGAALTTKILGFDATISVTDTDIKKAECRPVANSDDVCGAKVFFTVSRTF